MKLSDSEWRVMHGVWAQGEASAREVHDSLASETDWSYSTVRTLLNRLVEKGALSVEPRNNIKIYQATISLKTARASAVSGLLDRAFEGLFGNLAHHLVQDRQLNYKQRRQLESLLAALDEETEE